MAWLCVALLLVGLGLCAVGGFALADRIRRDRSGQREHPIAVWFYVRNGLALLVAGLVFLAVGIALLLASD